MMWVVSMVPLVYAEKTEEEGGYSVDCGAAFSLPKEGGEIVCVGKDSTFTYIKRLCQCFEMKETTSELKIRI